MTPKYAPPCPHRCCVDDDPHEHPDTVVDCAGCEELADVHPLARRALGIAASKHNPRSEP
jgi:hypothetical protein